MNRRNLISLFAIVSISLAFLSALISCQTLSEVPPARYGAMMASIPGENRAVLFGGRADGVFGLNYFNDLWQFDFISQSWLQISSANKPPARLSPGLVYDPINHQIIVFGGHGTRERLSDTWIFIFSENRWEEVTPAVSPPPRSDMGMVYDSENQIVVLFGGYGHEKNPTPCDDTWTYDPKLNSWTEMNPVLSPPTMYGHSLVYDSLDHRSVLWGGHVLALQNGVLKSTSHNNDFWRYSYLQNSWQNMVFESKPPARYWHQASLLASDGKMLIFGGNSSGGFLNDTWLFDMEYNIWSRVKTERAPSPRVNPAISLDPSGKQIILFGGLGEDMTDFQDTWIFQAADTGGEWIILGDP